MSVSYILRHGRTDRSARYITSGDPAVSVPLDGTGVAQCRRRAHAGWISDVVTCVVSEFGRTSETAKLLLGARRPRTIVDSRLNEINYGGFEGRPWMAYGTWLRSAGPNVVPPGGGEARTAAIDRMLAGLADCMRHPGPRMVVGHGLMISALLQLMADRPLRSLDLPEAPYVTPLPLTDARLAELLGSAVRTQPRAS